jgi:hypothetical protein
MTTKYWLNLPRCPQKSVDTFYVYPTVYDGNLDFAPIEDADMRAGAIQNKNLYGKIFDSTNFYAPFYRQGSLDFLESFTGDVEKFYETIEKYPFEDVKRRFLEFLDRYNRGRPIIFAGHSQGSAVLSLLLLWIKMNRPEILRRMVAAYLIGWPVPQEYLKLTGIPFARGSRDVGVIISYNTISASADATKSPFLQVNSLVINPINWRTNDEYAPKICNLGSFGLLNPPSQAPVCRREFADAWIDLASGGLRTTAPVPTLAPWPNGVLHSYDLALYWCNLRQNVRDRSETFCLRGLR